MQEQLFWILGAIGAAFMAALILGPIIIPLLRRLKIGQNIRDEGPQRHFAKSGTPTMGGIIIILAVLLAAILLTGFKSQVLAVLMVMICYGGIGFWDDYIKVVQKRSLGLRAREKIGLQLLVGLLLAVFLLFYWERGTEIIIPFTGMVLDLGYYYIPFLIVVMIGTVNAVNLTDGLDGLATGATFFVALAFVVISILNGHAPLIIVSAALAGACLGFFVFNRHPARIFMGDTGSMALGGAIAALAAFNKAEIALIIIGGVYVIEALSVIIQVISFQLTGKRIFLMSPLHHHFELKGWSEPKVVRFFYIMTIAFIIIGLLGYKPLY